MARPRARSWDRASPLALIDVNQRGVEDTGRAGHRGVAPLGQRRRPALALADLNALRTQARDVLRVLRLPCVERAALGADDQLAHHVAGQAHQATERAARHDQPGERGPVIGATEEQVEQAPEDAQLEQPRAHVVQAFEPWPPALGAVPARAERPIVIGPEFLRDRVGLDHRSPPTTTTSHAMLAASSLRANASAQKRARRWAASLPWQSPMHQAWAMCRMTAAVTAPRTIAGGATRAQSPCAAARALRSGARRARSWRCSRPSRSRPARGPPR